MVTATALPEQRKSINVDAATNKQCFDAYPSTRTRYRIVSSNTLHKIKGRATFIFVIGDISKSERAKTCLLTLRMLRYYNNTAILYDEGEGNGWWVAGGG